MCPILELDIGPIFLNLLGLVIDLSAIHLDITAVSEAGALLGFFCIKVQNATRIITKAMFCRDFSS